MAMGRALVLRNFVPCCWLFDTPREGGGLVYHIRAFSRMAFLSVKESPEFLYVCILRFLYPDSSFEIQKDKIKIVGPIAVK